MDKDQILDNNNEEYDPEIYTLTDEDGNELFFALLGTLENEGNVYKALIPVDENGEEESDEYVILKCSTDEIFDDEFADIFYDDQP